MISVRFFLLECGITGSNSANRCYRPVQGNTVLGIFVLPSTVVGTALGIFPCATAAVGIRVLSLLLTVRSWENRLFYGTSTIRMYRGSTAVKVSWQFSPEESRQNFVSQSHKSTFVLLFASVPLHLTVLPFSATVPAYPHGKETSTPRVYSFKRQSLAYPQRNTMSKPNGYTLLGMQS